MVVSGPNVIDQVIKDLLMETFHPMVLEVQDVSMFHQGHLEVVSSSENTHFSVVIVSDYFGNMSSVTRHRAVYHALSNLLLTGSLHALNIRALTREEYEKVSTSNDLKLGKRE